MFAKKVSDPARLVSPEMATPNRVGMPSKGVGTAIGKKGSAANPITPKKKKKTKRGQNTPYLPGGLQ